MQDADREVAIPLARSAYIARRVKREELGILSECMVEPY
jgi:hypothetical protein